MEHLDNLPITALLSSAAAGDLDARNAAYAAAYSDLLRAARDVLAVRDRNATLTARGLIAEAWLRLSNDPSRSYRDRQHFIRTMAQAMGYAVIDRSRRRRVADNAIHFAAGESNDFADPAPDLDVGEALAELERLWPSRFEVLTLKSFGGMTLDEIAEQLDVHKSTVQRHHKLAEAWMLKRLRAPN